MRGEPGGYEFKYSKNAGPVAPRRLFRETQLDEIPRRGASRRHGDTGKSNYGIALGNTPRDETTRRLAEHRDEIFLPRVSRRVERPSRIREIFYGDLPSNHRIQSCPLYRPRCLVGTSLKVPMYHPRLTRNFEQSFCNLVAIFPCCCSRSSNMTKLFDFFTPRETIHRMQKSTYYVHRREDGIARTVGGVSF